MRDIVERVARAICKSRFLNGGNEDDDGWDNATPEIQRDYLNCARAAIEAMREPTPAMLKAADSIVGGGFQNSRSDAEIWDEMIATALREAA